ncbi:hypothetical protein [Aestuariivirga litoralis]|uniref:hypothetical protein n=1 Tax=Aestuariivirga litoralis TaxID=2650924 RepID=UPI0018C4C4C0|nr:hypothetical protein [Aestuariivirga litoralis]MBG1232363.1 hypothetical protein [Aestuariivirga litoralis]
MQLEFQVIKEGAVVFKSTFAETLRTRMADLTNRALEDFQETSPHISLTDVTMKWETVPSEA